MPHSSSSGDDEAERSPEAPPNSNGSASTSLWQQLEEFRTAWGQFSFSLSPWDLVGKPFSMAWLAMLAYVTYQTTIGTLSFHMSHSCIKVVVNVGTFVTKCGIK